MLALSFYTLLGTLLTIGMLAFAGGMLYGTRHDPDRKLRRMRELEKEFTEVFNHR